jgi:hypothetical protein
MIKKKTIFDQRESGETVLTKIRKIEAKDNEK